MGNSPVNRKFISVVEILHVNTMASSGLREMLDLNTFGVLALMCHE